MRQVVAEVVAALHADLDRRWDLDALATRAGYSPYYFLRAFRAQVGQSPARYLQGLRLERAANALLYSDRAVIEIAIEAGFGSGEAFSRAFRKSCGASPRRWRGQAQAALRPHGPGLERAPPVGLALPGCSGILGPLFGLTAAVPSFEDPVAVAEASGRLCAAASGPCALGGLAQPWGWLGLAGVLPEFRMLRYLPRRPAQVPPSLERWLLPPSPYVTFDYSGPLPALGEACSWLMWSWIPTQGLAPGFRPTLTRLLGPPDAHGRQAAVIHVPVCTGGA